MRKNFYPRSPCGERPRAENHANSQQEFLSTLSLRRATPTTGILGFNPLFLSTLSLRRATLQLFLIYQDNKISIHALLAESDTHPVGVLVGIVKISIHALLAESDISQLLSQ